MWWAAPNQLKAWIALKSALLPGRGNSSCWLPLKGTVTFSCLQAWTGTIAYLGSPACWQLVLGCQPPQMHKPIPHNKLSVCVCVCVCVCIGFSSGTSGKEPTWQCRRKCFWVGDNKKHRFHPWVRNIPWRRAWQPTPVFLPGESHGQRSLVGYSP